MMLVHAMCPYCGPVPIPAADTVVHDRATLCWTCQCCGRPRRRRIHPTAGNILAQAGATRTVTHPEPHAPAPAITYDDLLDFHHELAELRY